MTRALVAHPAGPAGDANATPSCSARGLIAWALYDWAGSPFTTLMLTFVFPVYFVQAVVGDAVIGQALWGYAASASGLIIAVLIPALGAIADAGGRNKPWLLGSFAICALASSLMWFIEPTPSFVLLGIALIVIGNIGYASGVVFNNAMLPALVPEERIGRWSGWAWALGYAGGLVALILMLLCFIQDTLPWLPLNRARAENIRIVGPFVAVWFAVFAWPRFVCTPDRLHSSLSSGVAVRRGLATLRATVVGLPAKPNIAWFLVANMLYADALVAIFAVGGIYAAGAFKMTLAEVTSFGIVLNIAAGLGAFAFAWVDDWIGSRRTILLALCGLIVASIAAVVVDSPIWFWVAGSAMGLFVGPAQASSRSLMARLAPHGQETEFFGLFALSGKATAFLGPALVAVVTSVSRSQRLGLGSLLILLIAGAAVLLRVSEPRVPAQ